MKLKAVNNNEFTVELSIFGEKLEVIFIGIHDVNLGTGMCDVCPLNKDCFENDTLKYSLCLCFADVAYHALLPVMGFVRMKPVSALKIKKIINKNIGYELKNALSTVEGLNEQSKSHYSEFELL